MRVGVERGIYAGALVGLELVHAEASLRIPAFYGNAVEYRDTVEPVFVFRWQRCEPHHVARVACQCPAAVLPFKVVGVCCSPQDGLVGVVPRHAAFGAFLLSCLCAGKTAVHAYAVAHAERSRVGGCTYYLRLRLVFSFCHPHFARQVLRVVVGQLVNHPLQVARSVIPRKAASGSSLFYVTSARSRQELVFLRADVDVIAAYARAALYIFVAVSVPVVEIRVALVYHYGTFKYVPRPGGVVGVFPVVFTVETR